MYAIRPKICVTYEASKLRYLHKIRLIVLRRFPFKSKKGVKPETISYSMQPKAHRSDLPLYSCLRKNSGGLYSRVPKKCVVETFEPSFFVVTLEDETEEQEEDASSAIVVFSFYQLRGGYRAKPKSHSFVYPSESINTFSGFKLHRIKREC